MRSCHTHFSAAALKTVAAPEITAEPEIPCPPGLLQQARALNPVLESFLCKRSLNPPTRGHIEISKKKLPSISDQGPDQEGESEAQVSSAGKQGAIDRKRRDDEMRRWVERQEAVRVRQAKRLETGYI